VVDPMQSVAVDHIFRIVSDQISKRIRCWRSNAIMF
jgi:hypothetical protein